MNIPFPLFEPDKSPFSRSAGDNLLNCIPVADGWGPVKDLIEVSQALPSECLGAFYTFNSSDEIVIYAGTSTNLYRLDTSSGFPYSWTVASKSGGYTVPVGDRWQFIQFGNNIVAVQLGNKPQYIDIDSVGLFADITDAPKARYCWIAGDFLVLGHLEGAISTIRWSGINDMLHWTAGRKGSDIQVLPDGGPVMGGLGDQRGAVIIQEGAMRFMQFAPSSGYTFTFAEANNARGALSPYSIVQIGPERFVYLSEDGFFSGVAGDPIGAERVDRWFFENVDGDYLYNVQGMADPFEKIVWWRFRTTTGASRLLGYDWQLNRWCYSDLDVREAAKMASVAITWDGLDQLYSSIDDVDIPFDSRLFSGGDPIFGAFTSDNKLAFQTGANLAATAQTGLIELNGGDRAFVNGGRLITDAANHTVTSGGIDFHGQSVTYKSAASPSSRTGHLPLRHDARLHTFKADIPAGEVWTVLSGIDVTAAVGGVA